MRTRPKFGMEASQQRFSASTFLWILFFAASDIAANAGVPAIPEPGLIMYGTVRYLGDNTLAWVSSVTWTLTDSAAGATVFLSTTSTPPIRLITINGQCFYLASVPFETRRTGGSNPILFLPTPNSFELKTARTTLSRVAEVNGISAGFAYAGSNQFSMSTVDRGAIQRVDLTVPGVRGAGDFAAWSQFYFGSGNTDGAANADPDHDGMTNQQEFNSGTDPLDANSVFKLISFSPATGGAFRMTWLSVPEKSYTVYRSTNLFAWEPLTGAIVATGETTAFMDINPISSRSVHYRIRTNP